MTTPKEIAKRIHQLEATTADERPSVIAFHCTLASNADRDFWLRLRDAPPDFIRAVNIYYAGTDGELQRGEIPEVEQRFRISIQKELIGNTLRLFHGNSLDHLVNDLAQAPVVQIAELEQSEGFETHYSSFQEWQGEPIDYVSLPPLADPRKFVKDFTGTGAVPSDLRPWLLRTQPQTLSDAFNVWSQRATAFLMAALANEVAFKNGSYTFTFTGPPSRSVILPDGHNPHFAHNVQLAADWVFTDTNDAETRQLLFAAEWARGYNPHTSEPLEEVCSRSLESAQAVYSAYVRAASRETLKALAELREAVINETQKTSQRAHDLASALWKDIAVASAPFVLKILADAAKVEGNHIAGGLAFGAAAFLMFSFTMPVYINSRFFRHQSDSRVKWLQALGAILSTDEIREISEKPVREGLLTYKRVRFFVGLFYALLVTVLIYFGLVNLHKTGQPAATSASHADSAHAATDRSLDKLKATPPARDTTKTNRPKT